MSGFTRRGQLCYKSYPTFEQNGQKHTATTITKNSIVRKPNPVSACNPDEERNGALCYPKCEAGFVGNGPVCWETCGKNKNQGALCRETCKEGDKDVAGVCWPGCNEGYHDDGALCRRNPKSYLKGCCGKGCNNGCKEGETELACTCFRGAHIYAKKSYVPRTYAKKSKGRGAGHPLRCQPGQLGFSGLCYDPCPDGYSMTVQGTCWQMCPAGTQDWGLFCTRYVYNLRLPPGNGTVV